MGQTKEMTPWHPYIKERMTLFNSIKTRGGGGGGGGGMKQQQHFSRLPVQPKLEVNIQLYAKQKSKMTSNSLTRQPDRTLTVFAFLLPLRLSERVAQTARLQFGISMFITPCAKLGGAADLKAWIPMTFNCRLREAVTVMRPAKKKTKLDTPTSKHMTDKISIQCSSCLSKRQRALSTRQRMSCFF